MNPDSVVEVALTRLPSRGLPSHGNGGRRLDRRSLEVLRNAALAHMRAGAEVREVATTFGMSRSTLYRWRALAERGGRPAPEPLHERRDTPGYYLPLRERIAGDPERAGFGSSLWTKDMIRTMLARDFAVPATAAQVHRILHGLGVWPRRGLPRHDEPAGPEWLGSVLPRIQAKAATENADLYFLQDTLVADATMWLMSAVTTRGDRRFFLYDPAGRPGGAHVSLLRDFLERLQSAAPNPVYVILEPLPAEDALVVDRVARASNGMLHVFYLPDVLARLQGVTEEWRRALAAMKEHARLRDQASLAYQEGKVAEEELRVLRDDAIRDCRSTGVAIAAVVRHTGLVSKTIYDVLGRPLPAPTAIRPPESAAPARTGPADAGRLASRSGDTAKAARRAALTRLDEAVERWRGAVAATKDHSVARERATRAYRDIKVVEERVRAVRDRAIIAWRTTGIAAGALASRTGLSGGLISQIVGRHVPRDVEERRGTAGELLSALGQVSERWRDAAAMAKEQARVRDEAARAYREGKSSEEHLRAARDKAIAECRAAGVPVVELASSTGLDISTIYGVCHAAES